MPGNWGCDKEWLCSAAVLGEMWTVTMHRCSTQAHSLVPAKTSLQDPPLLKEAGQLGHHAAAARLCGLRSQPYLSSLPCKAPQVEDRPAYRDCRVSSKSCLQADQIWEGSGVQRLPMPAAAAPTPPARELVLQQNELAGSTCSLPDAWLLEACLD